MNTIKINGMYELFDAIQVDVHRYEIAIFRNGKYDNKPFFVSLQPKGNDEILPEYQLDKSSASIDKEFLEIIPEISEYLNVRNKRDLEELANSCKIRYQFYI